MAPSALLAGRTTVEHEPGSRVAGQVAKAFNQALATAYLQKQISLEVALARSSQPEELQEMINRGAGLLNRGAAAAGGAKSTTAGK